MPAGPEWEKAQAAEVKDISALIMSAADPEALARRWSELVGRPLDPKDPLRLPLDRGEVRFVAGAPGAPTLIEGLEIAVDNPAAVLLRAKAAGLSTSGGAVKIGGVAMRPTQAAKVGA